MSSSADKYARLSSLEEIAAEKAILKKRIGNQENRLGGDWQKIRSAWSFLPKIKNGINFVSNVLPVGVSVISLFKGLFFKK